MAPTALEIRDAVWRGELTATEACRRALDRIAAADQALHAFVHVDEPAALAEAARVDARVARGERPPLAGVPVAIKDNLCTRGQPTTAGSRMLAGYLPPYDATCVARIRGAGGVLVGKTNCDEFAMGSSTEHSAHGPTRNPWDIERTPGGSSGGSAAAVSAGMVPLALGSDTGGSVRQPAAFCGILGLKPTWGRVSRHGLIAFASSLDQVGPMARTAADAALLLSVVAGPDAADATCSTRPAPPYHSLLPGVLRDLRIGVVRGGLDEGMDAEARHAFEGALTAISAEGATLVDVELPHAAFGIPAYYLVATAEASANLARYDGVRYGYRAGDGETLAAMYGTTRRSGFGAEVKRRIMLGTYALSAGYYDAYYRKAQQARTLIRRDFEEAFRRADLLALPTTPGPAFKLGERLDDPLQMYLADVFTVGASLAGLPALSVPCGPGVQGLPLGLQLVGRMFDEETLLRTADAFEHATGWWKREPRATSGRSSS